MTEELCPVCGCTIVGQAYEKDGVKYCCHSCAIDSLHCECGCCHAVEEEQRAREIRNIEYSFVVKD